MIQYRGSDTMKREVISMFFCCFTGQKHLSVHKEISQSLRRVASSTRPQETILNNEETMKDKLLIDNGPDQECLLGGIVALGKFDALHIGHRQLAIHASKVGMPFLLSFAGMAEVLGWKPRPPIVAKCDRARVLSSWAPYCGNVTPREYEVEFSNVRHLTPRQFVERLSKELRVGGVVAGDNYRFGYKASGDAAELIRLCNEYGLTAVIVSPIMDKTHKSLNGANFMNSSDQGQVSSTLVRRALAMGDTDYVSELLGRRHRLVLMLDKQFCSRRRIFAPKSCALNQPPKDGLYSSCTIVVDDFLIEPATVNISEENITIEWAGGSFGEPYLSSDSFLIGIEF